MSDLLTALLILAGDVGIFYWGAKWGVSRDHKDRYPHAWRCPVEGCPGYFATNNMALLDYAIQQHVEKTGHGKVEA